MVWFLYFVYFTDFIKIMIINHLVLFHYRWAIPIIAEIFRIGGVKFIYLHKKLGITKGVLSSTLQALQERKYIRKNPGYGHPLRPEYIIHGDARSIANNCQELIDGLRKVDLSHLLKAKWNLPFLMVISHKSFRFSEIKISN